MKFGPGKFAVSWIIGVAASGLATGSPRTVLARDEITVTRDDAPRQLVGEVVVTAQDGGVLFRAGDGQLWMLGPDEHTNLVDNDDPFVGLTAAEIEPLLLAEFGPEFKVLRARQYVVCYNTSQAYAEWVGGMLVRLSRGLENFWTTRGLPSREPDVPLVVVVFDSQQRYAAHVEKELGTSVGNMVAYYNLLTNRVSLYDLTGTSRDPGSARWTMRDVNEALATPRGQAMVATIVHEATHQLMFNRGMQRRLADTPLWVHEGLATYFETPDLEARSGWRTIGQINPLRLDAFQSSLKSRGSGALAELLTNDDRFRDSTTATAAYGEAWALNFFLLKRHTKAYVEYLKCLSAKSPLVEVSADERLADFQRFFGEDLESLDRELVEFFQNPSGRR